MHEDNPVGRLPPLPLTLGVVGACMLSIVLVWLVGRETVVALAFGGALVSFLLMLLLVARLRTTPTAEETSPPDWSVTVSAIQNRKRAVAISDRANRLTCANDTFEDWFDGPSSPVDLSFDEESRQAILAATRTAWRDGSGEVEQLYWSNSDRVYRLNIQRTGRAEDYLVWQFAEIERERDYEDLVERIRGSFGDVMSRAGIEMALVAPDGIVQATTKGLAGRATGNANESLQDTEFVQLLRSDERDRIFFAQEGQQGSPQTLVHVPLDTAGHS